MALDNATNTTFEASFRQTGRQPEIWDAETGAIRDAPVWREEGGRTVVSLDYQESGSAFVVFRRKAEGMHVVKVDAKTSARPDPSLPKTRHTLSIKKAEYGVFGSLRTDCADVTRLVKPGVAVVANNGAMGGDPVYGKVKKLEVRYTLDGQDRMDYVEEGKSYTLPAGAKLVSAWYGDPNPAWKPPTGATTVDVTAKVAALAKDGEIDVRVENALAGRDPLYLTVKQLRVTYVYDGEETTETFREHDRFTLPRDKVAVPPPPGWEWFGSRVLAWQPLDMSIGVSNGSKAKISAVPPASCLVDGPWSVSFPAGWGAPELATFASLVQWNEHSDPGIKYFSGTATYRKRIEGGDAARLVASSDRVMLDLGAVKDFAEVAVNGKRFPVLWKPPFRVDVTDAVKGAAAIELEVRVTNLWPNRLIGDDRLCEDDCEWNGKSRRGTKEYGVKEIPEWVRNGKSSPTGRHTFTTWKHWSKEDELLPSGLIGPVLLRGGKFAD